uniref:Thioredoxin domain-containing protein n=1 Tax=Hemiselmis tepida TaxID=464990 RepID=A0A7S0WDJ7_9CRYP
MAYRGFFRLSAGRIGTLRAGAALSKVATSAAASRAPFGAPSAMRQGAGTFQHGVRWMASSAESAVQEIADVDEWNAACEKSKGKLIVAYHTAAWCGPCKMIWPHVTQIAQAKPEVTFLKIDVDEAQDVAAANNISAMPTFLFLKDGDLKDKLVGASPNELRSKIDALS